MANADFYPVTDANKLLFLDNLVTAVGTAGATVGLLPADITAITTARTNLRNAVNDKLAKKTAAQGATAAWAVVDNTTEEFTGSQIRRTKTDPAYIVAFFVQQNVRSKNEK